MESILFGFVIGLMLLSIYKQKKINNLLLKEVDILRLKIKQIKEIKNE